MELFTISVIHAWLGSEYISADLHAYYEKFDLNTNSIKDQLFRMKFSYFITKAAAFPICLY